MSDKKEINIDDLEDNEINRNIRMNSNPKEVNNDKNLSDSDILDKIINTSDEELMPWEDITLPSLGLYYDGEIPNGAVKVKPMGLKEEKILSTQRLVKSGQALDLLFKNCVRFPNQNFDNVNLLIGDRNFLMYYIRGITFGNNYEFTVKCRNKDCGKMITSSYDLNRLASTIRWGKNDLKEPFKISLPYLSTITGRDFYVKVRFLRGYDTKVMMRDAEIQESIRDGNTITINDALEKHLSLIIVEAMGESDYNKISALVNKLHSRDSSVIRNFVNNNDPGVDTMIEIQCPHCKEIHKMELPITETFFRSTD